MPSDREARNAAPAPDSHEERALNLLVQASRTDPTLRNAVAEVEKWVRRLQEDRSSAWQSYEEADVEAQYQMGQKLEAQQALWLILGALDLNPAELPAGWGASTKPILSRIEAIVDEADRLARERDRYRDVVEKVGVANALRKLVDAAEPFCGKLEVIPGRVKLPPEYYPAAMPSIQTLREAVAEAKEVLDV